jgi:peptidoglycan/LPS O-acetylase OafA/YrhL
LEQNFAPNGPFKLARLRLFSKWGKYTYGLYMLHPIGILIVDISLRLLHLENAGFIPLLLSACMSFSLSMIIAWLSYHWLEMPFLKIKEKFAVVRTKTA